MGKKKADPAGPPPPAPDLSVRVTIQPVTHCNARDCGFPVTYPREPGAASAALTAHYQDKHPAGVN
jgi:hypothetical protein